MQFPGEQILTELKRCELQWGQLDPKEHQQYVNRWINIYGNLNSSGCRKRSGFKAINEAQKALHGSFLIVPCRDPSFEPWKVVGNAYRCRGDKLPDLTEVSHYVDLFISPDDFSWTLYYGHEVDVFGGPVFTTSEWMSQSSNGRVTRDFGI
jgi:hypothetical protein